jgi:hypothetical protein
VRVHRSFSNGLRDADENRVHWRISEEARVAKVKTLEERLWGAAVLKMSFRLRGAEDSPAFRGIYPGVLRDLEVDDDAVEQFIGANQEKVEKAARGSGA